MVALCNVFQLNSAYIIIMRGTIGGKKDDRKTAVLAVK